MKKFILGLIGSSTLFLAGCGTPSTNTVNIQNFSFSVPTNFQSIPSSSLDSAQIANSILAAWK
jgi:PBP1b-binding outer membrane lipoprotein LpoB